MVAMLMQVSMITVLFSWKPAQIEHYKIAAPILLSISLYFFFKDFLAFLKIDKIKSVIISNGVEIEQKDSKVERFFHEATEDFSLPKILSLRSALNLVSLGIIGHLIYQYLVELNPSISISREVVIVIFSGSLSALAFILYYFSFEPLKRLQATALNQSLYK